LTPPRKNQDPELAHKTQAKVKMPDPELNAPTQAEAENSQADPERANKTQARAPRPAAQEPQADYDTGQKYSALEASDDVQSPSFSGDGDGLDALDPEVGSSTTALPQLERSDTPGKLDEEADDGSATHAGPPLKIEVVVGPDLGKKKKFKGVRMVIGRAAGVDFQLSDQSVSRRHVEIVQSDGGALLRDLGSGNGTKINGGKVSEKVLEHGDEISIGKTKMRFVDEVKAFQKAREENEKEESEAKAKAALATESPDGNRSGTDVVVKLGKDGKPLRGPVRTSRREDAPTGLLGKFKALDKKVRLAIIGAVGFFFFLMLIAIVTRPPGAPAVDNKKLLAEVKMQEARTALREGQYAAGLAAVEEAEMLVPGIDRTKLATQAKEELAFGRALEEARAALEAKHFEDAKKALEKAQKGSKKSDEAKFKLRDELEKAEIAYKKGQITEFLGAGELEGARTLLAELPVESQAESATKVAAYEKQLDEQKSAEARQGRINGANAAALKKERRADEIAAAFSIVERKFAGGEWERAGSECVRVMDQNPSDKDIIQQAKMLQVAIPNFGRNYDDGLKKFRAGSLAQAAKPLRQAHQLYEQMNLRANKYGGELEDKLGSSAVLAGREALIRDDLLGAYNYFKDAAHLDPQDSKARTGLDDVLRKTEELFQFAYMQKDRDPPDALRKFRTVVQVTEPGSTIHEKAKNQIAAMAP
jgi:pSer/pThr/pTyr-binding forkhead associated (FHA) protein